MQSIWHRIKRLSPYVELKEKVDYNKDLASQMMLKRNTYINTKDKKFME